MAGPGLSLTLALGLVAPTAFAADANPCLQAAASAAARHGVPLAILHTIAQAESGMGAGRMPWPWTLGIGGRGQRYSHKADALAALRARLAEGQTNLDIGCFQINYRWHARAFASLDHMISPAQNADHAARFLSDLHRETGNWRDAAGAYHSRRSDHAALYIQRLERIHSENMAGLTAPASSAATSPGPRSRPARAGVDGQRGAAPLPGGLSLAPRPPLGLQARPPLNGGDGA